MSQLDPIVVAQVDALLTDEHNPITNLANAAALLNDSLTDVNWVGFYLFNRASKQLDLGPFQGKVACMHIEPGKGVVGTAFASGDSMIVPDVHAFAGHIACDAASNSEVVVPITVNGQTVAILDIDSPSLDRFSQNDQKVLVDFATQLAAHLDIEALAAVC
ncbi:GAF domain-containing protein [Lacticaseibacillus pantheris]|jgi:GAF domain-containing protein|uniref:GAF domain-containing protein n=1 Tax=Lacticaseibacillus pantheris DSM 15945 = JCM 12539 = NBRC 106106 TaxID=1423783 RepID=A0A0R1TZD8_9LACO|nr:GAF domain-containing protein [Lacticaseibacillus pantheris]KRL84474.1 GAF domain-containing protein [Lacticaseibacillus pantheris DSM 15945 = JCM 12539 = NBRC 106106]